MRLVHPLPSGQLTDTYGTRLNPFTGQPELHEGIDLAAPLGTPILAAHDGIVRQIIDHPTGGWMLRLDHPEEPITTWYLHLQSAPHNLGHFIEAGESIALVGSTGSSTGPHLHFEVYHHGSRVDPLPFITRTQQKEEEMATPIYVTDSIRKAPFWALNPLTGKRRLVPTAEWKAIRAAEAITGEAVALVELSSKDLTTIPKA